MTRRLRRGHGGLDFRTSQFVRGHSVAQQGVVDHLVHKAEKKAVLRPKKYECCKDPSNLTEVIGEDEYRHGRIVQVCRHCYRRHIALRAEPMQLGFQPLLGRSMIVMPSRKTRKELRI